VLAGLGLDRVPMYGVSQIACTSVLRSVDLAGRFLARRPDRRAVLVLGGDHSGLDPRFRIIPGMTVTGDGAVALLVRAEDEQTRYRWLGSATVRDTRFHRGSRMTQEDLKEFTGLSTLMVTEAVDAALKDAGLDRRELDLVLPHSSNAMLWRAWSRQSGFPLESIYLDLMPKLGHTVGTDALICLAHAVATGRIGAGQRCALVSVGQGAYVHVAVVEIARVDPPQVRAAAVFDVDGAGRPAAAPLPERM
jgi:3-oxoacyl-[acyl-carrier-protein] synthase-3